MERRDIQLPDLNTSAGSPVISQVLKKPNQGLSRKHNPPFFERQISFTVLGDLVKQQTGGFVSVELIRGCISHYSAIAISASAWIAAWLPL